MVEIQIQISNFKLSILCRMYKDKYEVQLLNLDSNENA